MQIYCVKIQLVRIWLKCDISKETRYFEEVKQNVLYKIRNDMHCLNCGLA